jgi:hypothetical protein
VRSGAAFYWPLRCAQDHHGAGGAGTLVVKMPHPLNSARAAGRTLVLLAWLARSLDAPFFPPADLFGLPIENP